MDKTLFRFLYNGLYSAQFMRLQLLLMVSAAGVGERVDFALKTKPALFFEGITLRLYCTQASTDDIEIRSSTQLIVQGSHLVGEITETYGFGKEDSKTCVLVIKNLTRNESGFYFCREGDKTKVALVEAIYSPSRQSPVCTSNYDSLVIVNDLPLYHINFTCTTEQGNPLVLMQLHIFIPNSTNNITSIQKICTTHHNQLPNSRLLSCRIDNSLENATFVCNVSQQFPPPYTDSYRGSCSFGPIHFPPKFTLSVTPPYEKINEGANVTFTCTTNITGVEIKWINIPKGWKYNVTNSGYSSQLKIYDVKKESSSEIIVQCIGTYDIRKSRRSATITFTHHGQVPVGTVLTCCFFIMLFIAFLLGWYVWENKMNFSKSSNICISRQTSHQNEGFSFEVNELAITSNKNNANSKSLSLNNENEKSNLDPIKDRSNDEDASEMYINPVYESASHEAYTSELRYREDQYTVLDQKNSHVM